MKIKTGIIKILLLSALFLTACNSSTDEGKKHPNIVFILADDLGVPQLGCYGSSYYQTPNIDKLATKGVKFTNAYSAAAVCSPTRAAIFTGKHPAKLHITDYIPGNKNNNYPLSPPDWQKFLPLDEITIAEILKKNGYRTALFGKWHLSKDKKPPLSLGYNPDKQGFDETFITYKPAKGLPLGYWQKPEIDAHNVDTLTNLAINFIKRNQNLPFFLVLSHNSIHDPIMEKRAAIEKFKKKEGSEKAENNPIIAAMIERIDNSFGKIYNYLDKLGLIENTIIIFYSDNGAKESYAKQTPFKKGKGWLYEGGIRVPLIIQWKGKIPQNIEIDQPVTSMDLFPTIIDMISSAMNSKIQFDGINLYPLLSGNKDITKRVLFWNYPHYHKGSGMKPACAIRSGDYKLIEWYEPLLLNQDGAYELYNIKQDIGETKNLINEMPDKANELIIQLQNWKKKINAQEPTINLDYHK